MIGIEKQIGERRDPLTYRIIGAAVEVHRELGPGLLESTYEQCLVHELHQMGLAVRTQVPLPVNYKGQRIDCGYRIDLIINEQVIVEVKAVEQLAPIHEAQLLTYMRLAGMKTGLLINFNETRVIDGIKRMVF